MELAMHLAVMQPRLVTWKQESCAWESLEAFVKHSANCACDDRTTNHRKHKEQKVPRQLANSNINNLCSQSSKTNSSIIQYSIHDAYKTRNHGKNTLPNVAFPIIKIIAQTQCELCHSWNFGRASSRRKKSWPTWQQRIQGLVFQNPKRPKNTIY